MSAAFLAGLVAGYGVAIPVGAIAVLIVGLAARMPLRVGAAAAMAVATADGLYATVAATGGVALARLLAPVAGRLRWIAAAVLLGLAAHGAWRALVGRHRAADERHRTVADGRGEPLGTPGRAFAVVLGLTLLNPTTVVYFAALVAGGQPAAGSSMSTAALFVAGAFLGSASWQLAIVIGGSLLGRALAGPTGRMVTSLLSSVIIAVLAAALLLPHHSG